MVKIHIGGKPFKTTIGYTISPEDWSEERHKAKEGTAKHPVVNYKRVTGRQINDRISRIDIAFRKLDAAAAPVEQYRAALARIIGRKKTAKEIAAEEDRKKGPKDEVIIRFIEFFCTEGRTRQWSSNTLKAWTTFRGHLERFNKTRFNGRLRFSDFTESTLNAFVDFLRSDENLTETTAQKQYTNLKWFLKWAIRMHYCTELASTWHQPRFQKPRSSEVIALTKEELERLYSFQIPANGTEVTLVHADGQKYRKRVEEAGALEKTRDLFCFCCYTSLRYSDMAKLKRTDIQGETLSIIEQKTHVRVSFPLHANAQAILKKYDSFRDREGHALPAITNQKMNQYLKDLCELCGINSPITRNIFKNGGWEEITFEKWELVSTHAGRRTCSSIMGNSGIPLPIITKFTGHTDIRALRPYLNTPGEDMKKALKAFD
ncbi:MAG: site-specific integrase [Clostridia bacterium]|nr:site-specific integrase [Clostridia bacterium]